MEQSNCWAWTKLKDGLIRPSNEDVSWEEKAFAKDAAGAHGGCIWPPRSYSCSFCRREFRSAQALGGHMNVHRRDRARLKQSHNNDILLHHDHHSPLLQNNHINEVYNPNPNLDFNTRVFVPPTKDEVNEDILVHQYSSSSMMMLKHHKMNAPFSYPRSWSTFVSRPYYRDLESRQEEHKEIIVGSGCRALEGCVEPDLSIRLNSRVCRKRAGEEGEESYSSKRRASPLAFFIQSTSQEVLELGSSSSLEEIDLELRLGDRPKVK